MTVSSKLSSCRLSGSCDLPKLFRCSGTGRKLSADACSSDMIPENWPGLPFVPPLRPYSIDEETERGREGGEEEREDSPGKNLTHFGSRRWVSNKYACQWNSNLTSYAHEVNIDAVFRHQFLFPAINSATDYAATIWIC